jgi:NADH-quinone oxidoreductase subunit C/D
MPIAGELQAELSRKFGDALIGVQPTGDGIPTFWIRPGRQHELLSFLKTGIAQPFTMLYDLTAIDERCRQHRPGQPPGEFTLVYHLLSYERNADVRLKIGLPAEELSVPTVTDLWPAANWYEREAWDMFGIRFAGHPHLTRLLMPPDWQGHPLRKEHPARATEMPPFNLSPEAEEKELERLRFNPEEWGMRRHSESAEFIFLNIGPHHPGTHGLFRIVLQLDGENILDAVADIGYHHRAAEKTGERQTWHTYIPYTDRVDYLGGALNNLAYLLAVEKLAGIEIPERARVIRIMLCELFRISNHLVFYGTLAQDMGTMSPVFYMFTDRERVLEIIEAICGFRMHPGWFRIGGVAADLPLGWEKLVAELLRYLPRRLWEYDKMVMANPIFKLRTKGIGVYTTAEAIDWGVTGPGLRATGMAWDLRKSRPYAGYDQFDFEVPTGCNGDCYDRAVVHVEEMRQSLRIIAQCLKNMPAGPYKADHPLTTPPLKDRTMQDIDTLITHFLSVSWGPVIPPGEVHSAIEASKGANGYYLISDGGTCSYRTRIRTPSFAHLQMVPRLCRGAMISDLIAILGAVDFVLSDVDR